MKVLFIMFALLFFGCSLNTKERPQLEKDTSLSAEITCEIPIFGISNVLFPMLSEIIEDEKQCEYSKFHSICFFLAIKKYDDFIDFYFEDGNLNNISPSKGIGCFIFSDNIFFIDIPEKNDWMFFTTEDKIKLTKKTHPNIAFPYPNDVGSKWIYRYENKTISLIQKSLCKY